MRRVVTDIVAVVVISCPLYLLPAVSVISGGPFGPHCAMTSRLACALQNLFVSATAKILKAARSGGAWKDPFKKAKNTIAEVGATLKLCALILCAFTYADDQHALQRASKCPMRECAYAGRSACAR